MAESDRGATVPAITPEAKTKRGEFLRFVAERYGEYSYEFSHVLGAMHSKPGTLQMINALCQSLADREKPAPEA